MGWPCPPAYPFSYSFTDIGPGSLTAVSISVMALLEAIPGLANGRFISLSLPWRLGGLPTLTMMEFSNGNKPRRWSSPGALGSAKKQKLLGHFMRNAAAPAPLGSP